MFAKGGYRIIDVFFVCMCIRKTTKNSNFQSELGTGMLSVNVLVVIEVPRTPVTDGPLVI